MMKSVWFSPSSRLIVSKLKHALPRSFSSLTSGEYGLTDDQISFKELADTFAAAEFAPHAAKWDACKEFPEEALRKAADLGFAGDSLICCSRFFYYLC